MSTTSDKSMMRLALRLATRALGCTSPNPLVGAVLVKDDKIIGEGWHRQAGLPHAEVEALNDARRQNNDPAGATLYVTLEPCSTHGRTPPCTDAIIAAKIGRVVVAATDPNPAHAGRGLDLLREAGILVENGLLAAKSAHMNEAFNHWIVRRTPFVTVKAAMSMDGKIATVTGESKWITGPKARAYGMELRQASDAILAGVNTVIKDNPSLTFRDPKLRKTAELRRIVLDPTGRIPLESTLVSDDSVRLTTVVVTETARPERTKLLAEKVRILIAPELNGKIDLAWLLRTLGAENVTSLLVEGGGETNAQFLIQRLAQRIAFFYAPLILGGRLAPKGVSGDGVQSLADKISIRDAIWRKLGADMLLTGRVD